MYLSESWTRGGKITVELSQALTYKNKGNRHVEVPDPSEVWLTLRCGIDTISIRLKVEQADSVLAKLGQQWQEMFPIKDSLPGRDNTAPADAPHGTGDPMVDRIAQGVRRTEAPPVKLPDGTDLLEIGG